MKETETHTQGEPHERAFDRAIQNRTDVTERFFVTFGQQVEDLHALNQSEDIVREHIRAIMEKRSDDLFRLTEIIETQRPKARELLNTGLVAAVDGTNALGPITLLNTGYFITAVSHVTSQRRGSPQVMFSKTSTRYADPERLSAGGRDALAELCEELDAARNAESWPRTVREYNEREYALSCGSPYVFIDGPIFTQNLLGKARGRALYDDMQASDQVFIGVIKDIRGSWAYSKWCGYCLTKGEGFIVSPINMYFKQHYGHSAHVLKWIETMPDDYIRVVYRPNLRTFAFECRRRDLPLAIALLLEDASPTLHHELPLLLETVDAQLRAGFDASGASGALISRLQQTNLQQGIDLLEERDLR